MRLLILLLTAAMASKATGLPNAVAITSLDHAGVGQRPFTISRFFARGEIPRFATARVNGKPVESQCDAKTRWPDGSVQHALISFFAPTGAPGTFTVDFVDQPTGNNDRGIEPADMLSLTGWGARIEAAAAGSVRSADARVMLGRGALRYWLKGRVCSQVIVEAPRDGARSAFAYDFGWQWNGRRMMASADTGFQSLHPVFVLTFYRGWPGVKIEYILENTWTTKLQDQQYSLTLYKGGPAETIAYRRPSFTHLAKSRWRKVFWCGEQPAPVSIDYNLPYMIYSRVLPNYDLSRVVSLAAVDDEVAKFDNTDQGDISGKGQWEPFFPRAGGRGDIGLFPRWYIRYLYTFDARLYRAMLGNAEVSGHIPIHYRESAIGRPFRKGEALEAFGRVLSIDARPTVRTTQQVWDTRSEDAIVPAGPVTTGPWTIDMAHQSSFAFIPYLITGDWYFLEELYFWAAYDVARGHPGTALSYSRHADWGFINDGEEIRGVAWGLRNLAHAALAAPDGTAEKAYFLQKLYNNVVIREGKYDITDGAFYQPCRTSPYDVNHETSMWCWGRNTVEGGRSNPLHFLDGGSPSLLEGLDKTKVSAGSSPWMWNYNQIVLGHLKELGFPVQKLQETAAKNLINQITNPDYNPYLVASYRTPVREQTGGRFISSWLDVRRGYADGSVASFRESDFRDIEHGYGQIARAAASFLPGISDGRLTGQAAWDWINANLDDRDLLNGNPKWALVPRLSDAKLLTLATQKNLTPGLAGAEHDSKTVKVRAPAHPVARSN